MSTLVFGIGLGTFIIISLWITTLLLCFVSLRTQSNVGPIFVAFTSVFMFILFIIPRGTDSNVYTVQKVYDHLFIWRSLLVAVLGLSAVGAVLFYCTNHMMEARYTKLLRRQH